MTSKEPHEYRVRPRTFLLGAALVVVNNFWLMSAATFGSAYPDTVSLFHNVVFYLFALWAGNAVSVRVWRRPLLRPSELVCLYAMLCVATGVGGLDMMQVLGTFTNGLRSLATPENDWQSLFLRHVPGWLTVGDPPTLRALSEGEGTLYRIRHVQALLPSALAWSGFIFVLVFVMLALTLVVRQQWVEGEKLSYPIVQLPLHMTVRAEAFFRSRATWVGFAAAGGMSVINGLNFLYPSVPGLGGKLHDLAPLFSGPPWNAVGWTPISLFPYAVGLAFFMPLDLSFSCWFFYIFWKAELVVGRAMGVRTLPKFPYIEAQTAGAYAGLCLLALWATRGHLRAVVRGAGPAGDRLARWGMAGAGVGAALLVAFSLLLGMSLWVAATFFAAYFVLSIGITRMRAELGSPVHDLHRAGPHLMMVEVFGTRALSRADLTAFSFYQFFNRAYRGHPMPHQLEGLKLAEQARMRRGYVVWAVLLAAALAPLASFWGMAHFSFRHGIPNLGKVPESFGRLAGWLTSPAAPDPAATVAIVLGLAATLVLAFFRAKFVWFPLHPAGYGVSSNWSINLFWFSILVSWAVKLAVMRYGGLPLLRRVQPLFLGVVLGDFVVGTLWMLRGTVFGVPTFKTLF
jgi:hypothetical protein